MRAGKYLFPRGDELLLARRKLMVQRGEELEEPAGQVPHRIEPGRGRVDRRIGSGVGADHTAGLRPSSVRAHMPACTAVSGIPAADRRPTIAARPLPGTAAM